MQKDKPLILITNDDGIAAPGIMALVESVKHLGNIVVLAPDSPQSAMGHAITINKPLRVDRSHIFGDIEGYQCSGTPVDCVKLAHDKILPRLPDLVLSGINHGSNSSINVIYSGTMSAAVEAAIEGIPSIGFSLLDYSYDADFEPAKHYITRIVEKVIQYKLPKYVTLNVNIPKLNKEEIKGIKICRQARAKWAEDFDERIDPSGRKYYWLTGKFILLEESHDTDQAALNDGYVSVVPIKFDMTDYDALEVLKNMNL
ncbi:MAG: 5'/3'-nucleotidase SurE [Bacteroidota bacterium]|nr:5'/3'-nucleotidase SurE [Bacteroidota bacterium]